MGYILGVYIYIYENLYRHTSTKHNTKLGYSIGFSTIQKLYDTMFIEPKRIVNCDDNFQNQIYLYGIEISIAHTRM